jgi:hypothetical protein
MKIAAQYTRGLKLDIIDESKGEYNRTSEYRDTSTVQKSNYKIE